LSSSSDSTGESLSSKSTLFEGRGEGGSFFLVRRESIENLREFDSWTLILFPVDVMLDCFRDESKSLFNEFEVLLSGENFNEGGILFALYFLKVLSLFFIWRMK